MKLLSLLILHGLIGDVLGSPTLKQRSNEDQGHFYDSRGFWLCQKACRQGGFVSGRRARRRQRRFWKPTNSKCCLPAATREQPKPCRPGDASPEEAKTKNGTAGLAFH